MLACLSLSRVGIAAGQVSFMFGTLGKRSLLVGKARAWLLIVTGTLTGLVAGAGVGRYVFNIQTTPVGSAGPPTQDNAPNDRSGFDTSGHTASFVTVEPNVQLEVLDWGGTGETLVLLAGLGDNAHVFDEFAYQFTDRFHVIGITRRGFGRSSQPAYGYDLDTRARDDIAVLDGLNIRQAVFVGHSVAGTELSKLGAAYPDRVKKLVYLDALDIGSGGWATLPQPPPAPPETAGDLESAHSLAAAFVRSDGYRKPLAAICNIIRTDPTGRVVGGVTPPEISSKIHAGLQPAEYERIQLRGRYFQSSPSTDPYFWYLDPANGEFARSISRSRSGSKARQLGPGEVRGHRAHDTNHYGTSWTRRWSFENAQVLTRRINTAGAATDRSSGKTWNVIRWYQGVPELALHLTRQLVCFPMLTYLSLSLTGFAAGQMSPMFGGRSYWLVTNGSPRRHGGTQSDAVWYA